MFSPMASTPLLGTQLAVPVTMAPAYHGSQKNGAYAVALLVRNALHILLQFCIPSTPFSTHEKHYLG